MKTAYRQHIIIKSITGDRFFVERDGFLICTCTSIEDAKAQIDALLD